MPCDILLYTAWTRSTLAELEAFASFGLTGFLALHGTGVASHEALCAQSRLVFGVNLNQRTGDSQTQSFGLTFITAAAEIYLNIIVAVHLEGIQGLLDDVLKDGRGEVNVESALVDCDYAGTWSHIDTATAALRRPIALICSISYLI